MAGVIVVGEDGVLCREGDALHTRLGEGRGVATADGVDDVARLFDAGFAHRFEEPLFEVGVKAGELPHIAVHHFKEVLVGDGVDVDVPAVFQDFFALVPARELYGTAKTGFLGAAVEVDDAALCGHLVGVFLEVLGGGVGDADAGCVVHRSGGRGAGVLVRPHGDHEAPGDDEERHQEVERDGEIAEAVDDVEVGNQLIRHHLAGVGEDPLELAEEQRRRGRECEEERHDAEAHLCENGHGTELAVLRRGGVLPVPAGVGVAGEYDCVVILAVLGQKLAVHILGNLLLEEGVEPGLVEEDAAHKPDHGRKAGEEREPVDADRPSVAEGQQKCQPREYADPAGIGDAADACAGRHGELFLDGLDADVLEFARHIVGELFLSVGAGQTRTYFVCRSFDDAERFVGVGFEFFSHCSSCPLARLCFLGVRPEKGRPPQFTFR